MQDAISDRASAVINMSFGEIVGGTDERIRKSVAAHLMQEWRGYLEPAGMRDVRQLIADKFSPLYAKSISHENVVITTGATMGLMAAYQALSCEKILVPNPGFPLYYEATNWIGVQTVPYRFGLDVSMEETLRDIESGLQSGAQAILWNNPSNPLGKMAGRDVVERICELCHQYGAWCISDEVYRDFAFAMDMWSPCQFLPERTLFVYSFSKAYAMAGLRIGCVIGAAHLMKKITSAQWNANMSSSWVGQEAVKAALTVATDYPQMLADRVKQKLEVACTLFLTQQIPYYKPEGGIFICLDTRPIGIDSKSFSQMAFEQSKLLVAPCTGFGSNGHNLVRLSAGVGDTDFAAALQRVIRLYDQMRR